MTVSIVQNIKTTSCIDADLRNVLDDIAGGRWSGPVSAYRQSGDDRIKKGLPGVMVSGRFSKRRKDCLIEHSGCVCLDFDRLDDVESLRASVKNDPHTWSAFASPSGRGLKVLVRVEPVPSDAVEHKAAFEAAASYYEREFSLDVDRSGSDVSRLCFVSDDCSLYQSDNATPLHWHAKPEPERPAAQSASMPSEPRRAAYVQTALDKELAAVRAAAEGQRNHELNRAAYSLGQLVAGNLLSRADAESELVAAGLAVGLPQWEVNQTVKSGLDGGASTPRTVPDNGATDADRRLLEQGRIIATALLATSDRRKRGVVAATVEILSVPDWLDREPEQIEPVFHGLLDKSTKTLVVGPSKARKSFFTLQAALAVAAGRDLFDWEIANPQTVLLVQAEVHAAHYRRRVENMAGALRHTPGELGRLYILNGRRLDLTQPAVMDAIIERAVEIGAGVVAVDPLFCLMAGDESDQQAVRRVLAQFDRIIEATGAALVVVHHTTKGQAGDRQAIDRAAGSGLFARHCDSLITLTPHRDEASAVVVETITRGYPPRDPFTVEFEHGAFRVANHLSPIVRTSFNAKQGAARVSVNDQQILALFESGPVPRMALEDQIRKLGLSRDGAREARARLVEVGTIATAKIKGPPVVAWHGTPTQIKNMVAGQPADQIIETTIDVCEKPHTENPSILEGGPELPL